MIAAVFGQQHEKIANQLELIKNTQVVVATLDIDVLHTAIDKYHPECIVINNVPPQLLMSIADMLPEHIALFVIDENPNVAASFPELQIAEIIDPAYTQTQLELSVKKIQEYLSKKSYEELKQAHLYVKFNKQYEKVYFENILYVEALRNYVMFYLAGGKRIIHYSSISALENKLPNHIFERIHKSYIVNINKISDCDKLGVCIENKVLPVSKKLKHEKLDVLIGH